MVIIYYAQFENSLATQTTKLKSPRKLGSGKILTGYQTEREGINYL
jgi:hypothetical protein